jgi:hypothetical protein
MKMEEAWSTATQICLKYISRAAGPNKYEARRILIMRVATDSSNKKPAICII